MTPNQTQQQFYNYLQTNLHSLGDKLHSLQNIKGTYLVHCVVGLVVIIIICILIANKISKK